MRLAHPLFCLNAKKNRKSDKFLHLLKEDKTPFDVIVEACEQGKTEKVARNIYRKLRKR